MPPLFLGFELFIALVDQLFRQFAGLWTYLGIPIPIGVIGLWRWSVWLLRRFIGHFYRAQEPTGYWLTTAVITPVYNEDPVLFRAALRSWAANRPKEIIAVVDHTDSRCMEQFREFETECAGLPIELRMLITQTPGKRPALADGILVATSDVVFLVDSDTVWDPDVLPKALAPFHDPEVGGVTVRQRVLDPNSTAQRLFDVYLDIRYIDEIRFLTAFGDAVTCLSGRTAVYRRAVALTALEDLMEETFWGRQVISGDDKALTLAVQSRGWKVRYQDNTCVYTPGATVMKDFLKQRLRWARNSWRADIKALGSRWAWRKPILAFHLCDRLFQPLTTLVAPIYLAFALYHQNWLVVMILLSWWTISRTIKIWPHLRRSWKNIRILPWYITFNYWSAVTKIYAFFTMNQQGWITRWSRGGKANAWLKSLRAIPSYAATAATVALVAYGVDRIHETPNRVMPTQSFSRSISLFDGNPMVMEDGQVFTLTVGEWLPKSGKGFFTDIFSTATAADSPPNSTTNGAINDVTNQNQEIPSSLKTDHRPQTLCVMTGIADGSCITYSVPSTAIHPQQVLMTTLRTFYRQTSRQLYRILPQAINGQEATHSPDLIVHEELVEQPGEAPSNEEQVTNMLCVFNNSEERECQEYRVR